jgi:lipoate-protein ligase B
LRRIILADIGTTEYAFAWNLQKLLHQKRIAGTISDVILFTEHYNTYTIGKSGGDDHLLATREELLNGNVSVFKTDRGGDITYHGPGQIVCYPIIDLKDYYQDVHRYLRDLEEVVIRTLDHYGIESHREPEYTGVWVGSEKICAIGVKVSKWVTMHGFAFNVNTDLSYFGRIIPCGIFHKGVTSLAQLLGRSVDVAEVKLVIAKEFEDVFQTEIEIVNYERLAEQYHIAMEKEHASS